MTQSMDMGVSVVRRWQLAAALKQLREQADLTQEQAIERLRSGPGTWSRSKLSRVENREHHVKPREVEQLLDAYGGADAATRDGLVTLAAGSREREWWEGFGKDVPEILQPLLSLEAGLVAMRDFQSQLVHGLLQTADYARALVTSIHPGLFGPAELERRVAARMTRQQVLTRRFTVSDRKLTHREDRAPGGESSRATASPREGSQLLTRNNPPTLHFVLDETILQRLVGDRIVMHDQLRKLRQVAEKPNVTIQVLPRDIGGSPGLYGPFSILTLPDPIPDIGYTEGAAGALYIEDRDRVRTWTLRFGMLTRLARSQEDSVDMIAEAMRGYG